VRGHRAAQSDCRTVVSSPAGFDLPARTARQDRAQSTRSSSDAYATHNNRNAANLNSKLAMVPAKKQGLGTAAPRPYRPKGYIRPHGLLWRRYWHGNCVCQSQRLGGGTSRSFFGASARSIVFSASTMASDLLCDWPVITTFASDADQTHKFRPMP